MLRTVSTLRTSDVSRDTISSVLEKASTQADKDFLISKLAQVGIDYSKLPSLAKARIAGMKNTIIRKKNGGAFPFHGIGMLLGRNASGAKLLYLKGGKLINSCSYGKADDFLPEILVGNDSIVITDDEILELRLLTDKIPSICIGKTPRYLLEKIDALIETGRPIPGLLIAISDRNCARRLSEDLIGRGIPYTEIHDAKATSMIPPNVLGYITSSMKPYEQADIAQPDLFAGLAG